MNGIMLEFGPPTVLVIDDNPVVTRALATILRQEGYHPELFHCGADALAYIEQNRPAAAAIVDIHLPDLSGLILSSKLREHYGPEKPIIVLSGDTSIENIKSLAYVGATYFISKPFNPERLVEQLKELVLTTS
jgi:DNA-binding response OmpR family regulator